MLRDPVQPCPLFAGMSEPFLPCFGACTATLLGQRWGLTILTRTLARPFLGQRSWASMTGTAPRGHGRGHAPPSRVFTFKNFDMLGAICPMTSPVCFPPHEDRRETPRFWQIRSLATCTTPADQVGAPCYAPVDFPNLSSSPATQLNPPLTPHIPPTPVNTLTAGPAPNDIRFQTARQNCRPLSRPARRKFPMVAP